MSDLHLAVAKAALADADEIEYAYWAAVAEGVEDTRTSGADERRLGTLRLLSLATLRLPDLGLQASLLDAPDPPPRESVALALEAACLTGAGALRLTHRALEAHAAFVGYALRPWVSHALERTRKSLSEIEPSLLEGGNGPAYAQVRRIAVALSRAAAATEHDMVRVPDETATALGHLLALYMITNEAISP